MSLAYLPTTLKDDVLNAEVNTRRKYNLIENGDDTISLEDVTNYTQQGSQVGAALLNQINNYINTILWDINNNSGEVIARGWEEFASLSLDNGTTHEQYSTESSSSYIAEKAEIIADALSQDITLVVLEETVNSTTSQIDSKIAYPPLSHHDQKSVEFFHVYGSPSSQSDMYNRSLVVAAQLYKASGIGSEYGVRANVKVKGSTVSNNSYMLRFFKNKYLSYRPTKDIISD